jgi:hypothetical protein
MWHARERREILTRIWWWNLKDEEERPLGISIRRWMITSV